MHTWKFLSTLSLRRATIINNIINGINKIFLSTLSLRRATTALLIQPIRRPDFYPRSPCGERLATGSKGVITINNFYPRSPCGERRDDMADVARYYLISIHALLAESDRAYQRHFPPDENFYPRSPCGERLPVGWWKMQNVGFLSTLSLRRATAKVHKTVGHFCAYETNFMGIASSC